MTITKIIGEDGVRQNLCNGSACPTLILTDDEHVFIQGLRPDAMEQNHLKAPAHEQHVKMPVATLRQLVANL